MKIIILTEGSSLIGFGHVTRCLSLYQAFHEMDLPVQLIVNGDSSIEPLLLNVDYIILDWINDCDKLYKLFTKSDILVIDSYLADSSFYETLSQIVSLLVCIDDNKRISYPEGIIVNGNIYGDKLDYPTVEGVNYLLGCEYTPLRREFWMESDKIIEKSVRSIMITFGGDDLRNLTSPVLESLVKLYPNIIKRVVIGGGFKEVNIIEDVMDDNTELIFYPDANMMRMIMLESDIAVSGGGQTLYELARLGVPVIAVGVALNQTFNLDYWQRTGFISHAGFWDEINLLSNITVKLESLMDMNIRLVKSLIGKKLVDGKGAVRIARYCLNKYYSKLIKCRVLESKDIFNVYNLSNSNFVRGNSFNTDKIMFEDHREWFKGKLVSDDNLFLIVEIDDEFAGQVRFDFTGDMATVSISIVEQFRGYGLSFNILGESINYLKQYAPFIRIVNAYIKCDNKRSLTLFEKLGFKFKVKVIVDNQPALNYQYKL